MEGNKKKEVLIINQEEGMNSLGSSSQVKNNVEVVDTRSGEELEDGKVWKTVVNGKSKRSFDGKGPSESLLRREGKINITPERGK